MFEPSYLYPKSDTTSHVNIYLKKPFSFSLLSHNYAQTLISLHLKLLLMLLINHSSQKPLHTAIMVFNGENIDRLFSFLWNFYSFLFALLILRIEQALNTLFLLAHQAILHRMSDQSVLTMYLLLCQKL